MTRRSRHASQWHMHWSTPACKQGGHRLRTLPKCPLLVHPTQALMFRSHQLLRCTYQLPVHPVALLITQALTTQLLSTSTIFWPTNMGTTRASCAVLPTCRQSVPHSKLDMHPQRSLAHLAVAKSAVRLQKACQLNKNTEWNAAPKAVLLHSCSDTGLLVP